ncbi:transporter substrate-binding domain-containing protein [Catenovulum sp. 2E275]|uniref:transporter substrate-binding domain-containing protein n=1 Tax=Catenovulum sp. 2E275 TaxID=2980497 RepID=UPI0021D126C1|nr:transporter substrate-binding domain-containing protein [Catenovulum sp. 2E275]MCU4674045.1 transporter substrate-binding domain-containing protein [Catenovulum sp. 2E275]
MKKLGSLYLFCIFLIPQFANANQPLTVQGLSTETKLPNRILKALIEREGGYDLVFPDDVNGVESSEVKLHTEILSGERDLMWTLTSKQHEDKFQPIYIPLYRGLIGMRIAIVKSENIDVFNQVKTLQDLTSFKAGQGLMWADTKILEANGLTVVKELKYLNLFPMLEGERFDYFPRGLPEPWSEIERESKYNLAVEPNILIRYKAPFYFFVRKGNEQLRQYIEAGLEKMIADGTYEAMFFNDPQVKQALSQANVKNRVVIDLQNPNLTAQTPVNRQVFWFDPVNEEY